MTGRSDPSRRQVLAASAATLGSLAGCAGDEGPGTESTAARTTTRTGTGARTATTDAATTRTSTTPAVPSGPDLAATYRPAVGDWGDCATGEPAAGHYDRVDPDLAATHADRLLDGGVARLRFAYPGGETGRALLGAFREGAPGGAFAFDLEPRLLRRATDGDYRAAVADVAALAGDVDAVAGLVVDVTGLRQEDGAAVRDRLRDDHGSLPGFVDWLREQLPDLRLVAAVGMPGTGSFEHHPDFYAETVAGFDAVTNAVWPPGESDDRWSALHGSLATTYRTLRSFGVERDVEFEPAVPPGLPEGVRACDDDGPRAVPRDPDEYGTALRRAVRYATDDRVTVSSFNDWSNGTQLEPGIYAGESYGSAYLDATRAVRADPPADLDRSVYHVSPDGDDADPGSEDRPLATVQRALDFAGPGDVVHLLPGEYRQDFRTVRPGEPGNPIEITGPRDAVVKGAGEQHYVCRIGHSHVHLTGCSFDGLLDPDAPDDLDSYGGPFVNVLSRDYEFVEDVKVTPAAMGNSRTGFVNCSLANHVEIGEFEVTGLAGAIYVVGDAEDHVGEVVYVGTPRVPMAKELNEEGVLDGVDDSHDYHVHHIDNSAGHPHAELVDTKAGVHDVTVEYCTDGGGSQVTDEATVSSIALTGHDCVVRWNDLRGGTGAGVKVDADAPAFCRRTTDEGHQGCVGFDNAIYGNRIAGYDGYAVMFEAVLQREWGHEDIPPNVWPGDQRTICGNDVEGRTHAEPESACPDGIPAGDGVGHLGGDGPWA